MADLVAVADDTAVGPHAAEIFRPRRVTSPDRRTREILSIACDMIKTTTDDLAGVTLDVLARELAAVADRLATRELMLSEALTLSHTQHVEIQRLRRRVADLLDLARAARQ